MGMKQRWLGNSMANLVAGGSVALFNFAVPAVLARHLPALEFSVWSLALQIVAYLFLFGLGIQTAVAKYIAESHEHGGEADQQVTVASAGALISMGVLVGIVAVLGIIWLYPLLFPGIPSELLPSFRWALCAIGISSVLQLFSLLPVGIFTGLYQNIYFVACQVLVRIATVAALWWAVNHEASFIALALIYAGASLLVVPLLYAVLLAMYRQLLSQSWLRPDRKRLQGLFKYCAGLSVWIFSMLLVNSVSTILVGRFELAVAGSYALALTFNAVMGGVLNSVLSPLVPMGSAMHASADQKHQLPALLVKTTFWCVLGLHLFFLGVYALGIPMLHVWVGEQYADQTYPILMVLLIGNVIRNIAMPYATLLLATALHRKAVASALVEGCANLLASIVLGYYWGALGVAWGTVVGAMAGVLMHVFYNFGRTPELTPLRRPFLLGALGKPTLIMLPFYVMAFLLL